LPKFFACIEGVNLGEERAGRMCKQMAIYLPT